MYKFVVFSPRDERTIRRIIHAASVAGAGKIGDYDECAFVSEGYSTFRPLSGACPTEGEVQEFTRREEVRIEMDCPKEELRNVLTAIQAVHPYEKVVIDAVEVHRIE
jgi:hypothetical protein